MVTISVLGTWGVMDVYVVFIQFKVKYCWLPYCCNSIKVVLHPESPKQLHSINIFFFFLRGILCLKFLGKLTGYDIDLYRSMFNRGCFKMEIISFSVFHVCLYKRLFS